MVVLLAREIDVGAACSMLQAANEATVSCICMMQGHVLPFSQYRYPIVIAEGRHQSYEVRWGAACKSSFS